MNRLSHEKLVSGNDLLSSSELFEQFLNERKYLKNVTTDTLEWYETAFKALQRALDTKTPVISRASLQHFVVAMRQRGVKPVSVNTYIKALNAFCRWLHDEGHHTERLQLPLLKIEKRVLQTLTDDQLTALLTWKPKGFEQSRLHALVALVLETGLRIEEALTLRLTSVDYDNLLLTAFGKGRKERRVPFSFEARKALFSVGPSASGTVPTGRVSVPLAREHDLGPAQQPSWATFASRPTAVATIRLAPPPPHIRDELSAPRWRHRAAVHGAGAHPNHHDPALSAPPHGGPECQPPEGVDLEPAWVRAVWAVQGRFIPSHLELSIVGGNRESMDSSDNGYKD